MRPPPEEDDEASQARAEHGFPDFENSQWTVEGEIERFGAFAAGVSRSAGWRRGLARAMALLLLALLICGALVGSYDAVFR